MISEDLIGFSDASVRGRAQLGAGTEHQFGRTQQPSGPHFTFFVLEAQEVIVFR